jgi:SNF family Na+-dependent transporter
MVGVKNSLSCCHPDQTNVILTLHLYLEYGGGIFFLPCLVALFSMGLPLLLLEIAVGQHVRSNDVAVCGHLSKHFRGVGLASIFSGFCIICYYVPLISWCLRVFFGT